MSTTIPKRDGLRVQGFQPTKETAGKDFRGPVEGVVRQPEESLPESNGKNDMELENTEKLIWKSDTCSFT
jgi:hypothetical protein